MQQQVIADRYELGQLIGRGGMGEVWAGYDRRLDRPVAVKLIRPDLGANEAEQVEHAARFTREAQVTAQLDHPGVPAVHDVGSHEGRLYLVMQRLHGIALADLLAETNEPLPISWAVTAAAQICSVLSAAHAVPLVHRDLKPSNVMLCLDGAIKVLDFGIAAVLREGVTQLTSTGQFLGSAPYVAPEQALAGKVSPRTDLYALGCLLHELLAGSPPFQAETAWLLISRHVHDRPAPLRSLRPDVPEHLEQLVLHLLAKEADHRPVDAQAVYDRLVPFLPASGSEAQNDAPVGMPDPTQPYRKPLGPRPRPRVTQYVPTVIDLSVSPPEPQITEADVVRARKEAIAMADDGRHTQAAEILGSIVAPAIARFGARAAAVLEVRLQLVGTHFLGGDYRRALPDYLVLAKEFATMAGPLDERSLHCRQQGATCYLELGDFDAALAELQSLLADRERAHGPDTEDAVLLRGQIARLLLSRADKPGALQMLTDLRSVVHRMYGPQSVEAIRLEAQLKSLRKHLHAE
ncbi:serine/threonine-protein kinase [Streptomyces sp. CB02115]|uniref:serine/threonine-protein kinase n=1 Tax=Streptomyces sp. CB02115 TaxID=1703939 RepID=UPI00093C3106|nr:serine/threonine-protein kinase [Streptomyces sp. CB02115]OKJ49315.1 hypothetical protein AMK28_33055 [Streptomyces sp. CB02115]